VPPVKSRQELAAEETQRVIIQAATRLFLKRGYYATSIAQIAATAGVAVQTIYNSIGSKRDVLSRVLDHAAAGDRAPQPVPEFMRQQAEDEPDPSTIILQLIEFWREALPRTAPIFKVIRQAAAVDERVAALEQTRASQRLRNYETAAALLNRNGALRTELSIEQAAATIFAVGHPETYRALVLEGNWPHALWETWAQTTLTTGLLPDGRDAT
jgi:AcrR family transcriptional regulator